MTILNVIIPVYRNESCIQPLLAALVEVGWELVGSVEFTFVVDGSPDRSAELLMEGLPTFPHASRIIQLSRNFGAFAAIRAGLDLSDSEYVAVLAADLQEPAALPLLMVKSLQEERSEVCLGSRVSREDPLISRWSSNLFWTLFRRLVITEMPRGGVDVFACTRNFVDHLKRLEESNTSLIGLLFWPGFKRSVVPYHRAPRHSGESAWTLSKKARYLLDSIFGFSDLPIRLIGSLGFASLLLSLAVAVVAISAKVLGSLEVPGYTTLVVLIAALGGANLVGLSLVGGYLWRTFENTKRRPPYIVWKTEAFRGRGDLAS